MLILVISLLFFVLLQKFDWCLWFALPLSIFLDLWKMKSLGISGLEIVMLLVLLRLFFGPKNKESYKLKI